MKLHQLFQVAGVITLSLLFGSYSNDLSAQDEIEVEGIIHSKLGGFKFPDDTVQATAAAKLTGEEVADKRGKMTISFSGITNVRNDTNFDLLHVAFMGAEPYFGASMSDVEIIMNLEEDWPNFFIQTVSGNSASVATIRYYDENNVHYMTHRFAGAINFTSFSHVTNPFSSSTFGHVVKFTFNFADIAVIDEINNYCKCFDFNNGVPSGCGCP